MKYGILAGFENGKAKKYRKSAQNPKNIKKGVDKREVFWYNNSCSVTDICEDGGMADALL